MAEALAIEGAKWVASTIVTGLLREGFSYLGIGISAKLQELETTILPQFQLVIEAAERSSEHKAKLERWVRRLKDAVYEAEDMLDLYKYQDLKEKVSDLNTRPALKPFKRVARKVNAKLSILSPQMIKLRISLNKLEKIAAKAKTFCELLQIQIRNDGQNLRNKEQPKDTSSFPLHKVFGREKELGEIIKYILDPSEASKPEKNYSVGAIVAIGGAGKTTLAQLVYRDTRVVKHFDIKMWVGISRKLDLAKHTKDMIESSGKSERPNLESGLEAIQSKLAELVNSKKILLVLDDVWFDRSTGSTEEEWLTLVAPLAKSVKSGSKVLVTTRTTILPVALRPQYSMLLKDLEEKHILSLFKIHAFPSTELDGSRLQDELMTIGKQIVQKLHGSPLAARAVGSRLGNTLNVGAWKRALDGDNLRDSQQALLWSYQRLDARLQRCFSYCSLFPKGHHYGAEEMIRLWIAEGFINSSNNSKGTGMEYFDELVFGSFLQKYREYNEEYYNMHDLFHDLAENVSKEDCLRIEDGDQEKEITPTIRHLSIWGGPPREMYMSFNQLENLRTLIVEDGSLSSRAIAALFAAAEKYKKLRLLSINDVSRETLAKLVPNLKHLRFLSFQLNEEGEIPAAVGKLYHLQVLDVRDKNASLPRSLTNLINLRHFEGGDEALASLPDIGRLTSLQTLPRFVVKNEKGHDIGQLKNLNELRGSLTISNLKNVVEARRYLESWHLEAFEKNLTAKTHLEQLHLEWDSNDESEYKRDLDIKVLEGLQPHFNLIKLSIEGYKSPRFPCWLRWEGYLQNLTSLILKNCTALQVLPSLPQSLKDLKILNCPSLIIVSEVEVRKSDEDRKKSIMTAMQSYQLINRELKAEEVARDCLEVQRLLESEKVGVPEEFMFHAAILQSCERKDDVNLQKVYYRCQEQRLEVIFGRREKSELILPSSLQTLELDHCNITDGALSQSLQGLTSLKSFKLYNISALTTLCVEKYPSLESLSLSHQTALTSLLIGDCRGLSSLLLNCLESLNSLKLLGCPSISSLPEHLPQSLNNLELRSCPSISSLPKYLPQSLNYLYLDDCPSISSLPEDLPRSLNNLKLLGCPSISSLPEHLPQSLNSLELNNCPSISSLPEDLPQSLNNLKLLGCPSISSLPEHLPQSLNNLELNNCPSISSFPEHLPQSLNGLKLFNYPSISSLLEHLPQSLNSLELNNCPRISSLPEHLPQSLNSLELNNCLSISSLPEHLPQSLNSLELCSCPSISSLPEHLPQSLNSLYISNCLSISSLPEHLSQSLNSLRLSYCPSISSLPKHLPQSLDNLQLWDCPNISSLSEHLPQSLNSLRLSHCPSISSLPEHLPQSLNYLYLDDCPSISSLPEHLPQSLRVISIEGCQILKERCRSPNGEDWPKIAHIPDRRI